MATPSSSRSSQEINPYARATPGSGSNQDSAAIVASTDSVILDAWEKWTNLAAGIIMRELPQSSLIDLSLA